MPLINQPQLNIGDIDIAANPYVSFEREWIGFDLIIQNGTTVLYAPKSSFLSSFNVENKPPITEVSIIPYIYSDLGAIHTIFDMSLSDGLPTTGNILTTSLTDYFDIGGALNNLKPNTPYSYLMAWNLAGKKLAITKQAFHLNLIEGATLSVSPALERKRIDQPSNAKSLIRGLQMQSGGYWEDNVVVAIPDYPESLSVAGAHFQIATPLSDGYPENDTADISGLNMELSVYAEVREIIT